MTNEKSNDEKNNKLLDCDFDGIKEYDNPIPIWFQIIFYGTIIFSIIYFLYYHVYKSGQPLMDEYLISMKQGNQGDGAPTPSGNTPANDAGGGFYSQNLTNKEIINLGKQVYDASCASCHGVQGQGGVGPNLVDDYWIVDNTYQAVEHIIDEGVPQKGMPGWKTILGDKKVRALVVYIASLQGTNPPNPKKSEGKPGKLH